MPIAVSRDSTLVEDGDKLLICRLRYRVAPGSKGEQQSEDFEFFGCTYSLPIINVVSDHLDQIRKQGIRPIRIEILPSRKS